MFAEKRGGRDFGDDPFRGDGLEQGAADAGLRGEKVVERERAVLDETADRRVGVRFGRQAAALAPDAVQDALRRFVVA